MPSSRALRVADLEIVMSNPTRKTYVPDQLMAGDFPVVIDTGVIAAGQNLQRGAVLGQIKSTGEYVLCVATADDGSQVPAAVLDQAADATGGAVSAPILLTGEVSAGQLTLGEGLALAAAKSALRSLCLFIR